ncbi:MAG: ribosome-associated translation inhibitor RaiA [Deltaproteobacteria bacterium]|nr:ribosome-associated translation inhibitor RaiA [Deltaproteobacteria bacterium]
METEFIFRHMDATEGLKAHTQQKIEKLQKHMMRPTHMKVIFSMERFMHRVDITFHEEHEVFHALGETNDMYASIDQAMHSLEEQLRRYRDRMKDHKNYPRSKEGKLRGAGDLHDTPHLSAAETYYEQHTPAAVTETRKKKKRA